MKKVFFWILTLNIIVVTLIVGGFFWWSNNTSKVSNDAKKIRVVIERGSSGSQVGEKLYKAGLIKDPLAFKVYLKLKGKTNSIQAGEFELSSNLSLKEIVEKLGRGPLELLVTIPEGLRQEEIAERFIKGLEKDEVKAADFRAEFLTTAKGKEGYLYPDTYLFPRDVDGKAVVTRMLGLFDKQVVEDLADGIKGNKLNLNQIVTLASIIEREAKTNEERPVVAGIYLNRLDLGMPLQADATVQYAVANENCKLKIENCKNWWPVLSLDDLEFSSRFNTYKNSGLPPSPIANPGMSSIRAAIYPEDSDYLFYIHDKEGNIHYAETLEGHNNNINRYLKN